MSTFFGGHYNMFNHSLVHKIRGTRTPRLRAQVSYPWRGPQYSEQPYTDG